MSKHFEDFERYCDSFKPGQIHGWSIKMVMWNAFKEARKGYVKLDDVVGVIDDHFGNEDFCDDCYCRIVDGIKELEG